MEVIRALADTLINKADFGLRLKKAYDSRDNASLTSMVTECDIISDKLKALREVHRKAWMEYNKSFGWEVHDIRYGGLIARFDTVKNRISAYLSGEIPTIEELEVTALRFDGMPEGTDFTTRFLWLPYTTIATPGIL